MAQIEANGPLSFRNYVDQVLYDGEDGYYARPERVRTGRAGDFFTAVSVGPLFGRILAEQVSQVWRELREPETFRLVEWGSEQGDLLADIQMGAEEIGGAFARALRLAVVEPLSQKRALLAQRFPQGEIVAEAGELSPQPGMVIANELIDALSFWLLRREQSRWWEKRVTVEEGQLAFTLCEPGGELAERLALLPEGLPEGYETELRPSLEPLLREMSGILRGGEILLFDYGYERADYYHPSRTTGTLRTYGRHRAGEDPLESPGERDITAHVDFTALGEEAEAAGLAVLPLSTQGNFLTRTATSLLKSREGRVDAEFIRQFQTLTHPGHLGTRFTVFRARQPVEE
ncbi:class I SAM-dependent methyltransferase [Roseibacillus ishigakijimensis]|uniref:SAM-dependent methyltransferase n=1 Tax=Roseibacillus ishigakijimensis TaxID=454146 RepID=A0A934RLX8_9BACT|nr:SAM-dependent methyltransferase [Roseibacillus ishigakijimensis]MBK1834187.1 SAM-dependent methyltransferase [Roseibacillus ishigakijimensis]